MQPHTHATPTIKYAEDQGISVRIKVGMQELSQGKEDVVLAQ